MDTFVKLTVVGKLGNITERVFNLRYVKSLEHATNTVLLYGNSKPFRISGESMDALLHLLDIDGHEHRTGESERGRVSDEQIHSTWLRVFGKR